MNATWNIPTPTKKEVHTTVFKHGVHITDTENLQVHIRIFQKKSRKYTLVLPLT